MNVMESQGRVTHTSLASGSWIRFKFKTLKFSLSMDFRDKTPQKLSATRYSVQSCTYFSATKGVYMVSIVKQPLLSTLPYLFAIYDFMK